MRTDLPGSLLAAVRQAREDRRAGGVPHPSVAVLDGAASPDAASRLAEAGWRVEGRLAVDAPGWADGDLADPVQVLLDPGLDAVCLDGPATGLLGECLAAGLGVLLAGPPDLPPDTVRAALQGAQEADGQCAVAFGARWQDWARGAAAALAAGEGPPAQMTVRGWPTAPSALLDLVDVVRVLAGEVVAVAARPAPLPADVLPPLPSVAPGAGDAARGDAVRLALLLDTGATVLVAEAQPPVVVRLSCRRGLLEAGPRRVVWSDGSPVRPVGPALPGDLDVGPVDASDRALLAPAAALRAALENHGEPLAPGLRGWSAAATLADLLVASEVVEGLRRSAREGRWVELT